MNDFQKWLIWLVLVGLFVYHPPIDKVGLGYYGRIFEVNKGVRNIHNGGCGWFALYGMQYFERLGVKCTVVFCGEGEIPKHIFIKNKYGYCDNKGIFSRFAVQAWFGGKIQEKSPQDLKNILKKNGWNKQFCLQDTVLIKEVFK